MTKDLKICTKRRYKTKEEAEEMSRRMYDSYGVVLKTYKCRVCHNYHHSSKVFGKING